MTYLYALLSAYCLIAGICLACIAIQHAARSLAGRRKRRQVVMIEALPVATVHIATAWRRSHR